MTEYKVKTGEHDFKPNDHPRILGCRKHECHFSFILDVSMWYPINDPSYPYGSYNGWNKLGFGFTQGILTNTRRTCLVAEFPSQEKKHEHRIALYINKKNGDWDATEVMTVKSGIKYSGHLAWFRYEAFLYLQDDTNPAINNSVRLALPRSNWLTKRAVGAWHGGKYPAHQDRSFLATHKYTR